MHCPECGEKQFSDETRFCSRCGFKLTTIAEVLRSGGESAPQTRSGKQSPRQRGIKQGIFWFLLSFLVVPILTMLTIWMNAEPFAVVAAFFLFVVGGILRVAYAFMFESNEPGGKTLEEAAIERSREALGRPQNKGSLPEPTDMPVSSYSPPSTGKWLDTNELERRPESVTEPTTRLLDKQRDQ